jgi:hypothetical protein
MKTWREQAEDMGATITVDGIRVTVHSPQHSLMARDVAEMAPLNIIVENCCKMLVKHIEGHEEAAIG